MAKTVALDSHADLMEHRPISLIEHDRVAAEAAAHDALAGGVALLIVAGGPAAARAALARSLTVDRLAAGEDVLAVRDGGDPVAAVAAYLELPAGPAEGALAAAIAVYATAQTRLVVLLEQAETLASGGLAGVRRLREADPAATALSLVLLGDDMVALVADRLLRPSPPGGLRFIRLTPLALAPAAPVTTFPLPAAADPPLAPPEDSPSAPTAAAAGPPDVAPPDTAEPYADRAEQAPGPVGFPERNPEPPPGAPYAMQHGDDHDDGSRFGGVSGTLPRDGEGVDPDAAVPGTEYQDAFAQLAARDAAPDSPRTHAQLRRSAIIPPLTADLQDSLQPEPGGRRPRLVLPLAGIALLAALVGWFVVHAMVGIQTPMQPPRRAAVADAPQQQASAPVPQAAPPAAAGPAADAPPPAAPAPSLAEPSLPPVVAAKPDAPAAPQATTDRDGITSVPLPPLAQQPPAPAQQAAPLAQQAAPTPAAPPEAATQHATASAAAPPASAMAAPPVPAPPTPAPTGAAAAGPGLLVIAKADDTLHSLYARVYKGLPAPPFEAVAAMNPHEIKLGDVVVFPAPPGGWKRLPNTAGR